MNKESGDDPVMCEKKQITDAVKKPNNPEIIDIMSSGRTWGSSLRAEANLINDFRVVGLFYSICHLFPRRSRGNQGRTMAARATKKTFQGSNLCEHKGMALHDKNPLRRSQRNTESHNRRWGRATSCKRECKGQGDRKRIYRPELRPVGCQWLGVCRFQNKRSCRMRYGNKFWDGVHITLHKNYLTW